MGPPARGRAAPLKPNRLAAALLLAGAFARSATSAPGAQEAEVFPPPGEPRRLIAARSSSTIRLDGRLDEAAWGKAEVASGFVQVEPDQGTPASQDTEVRLLFDDRSLYVGALCRERRLEGSARVRDMSRDFDYFENDLFGIVLDPWGEGRVAIAFQVTPLGTQRDLMVFEDSRYDRSWDTVWSARTAWTPEGWTVEMEIPWSSLRYPRDSGTWGVNFVRIDRERTRRPDGRPGRGPTRPTGRPTRAASWASLRQLPRGISSSTLTPRSSRRA